MRDTSAKKPLLYTTELSEHITMNGELITAESLLVLGRFSGTVYSSDFVTFDRGSAVDSSTIHARHLRVSGRFSGAASALESIEIEDGAHVEADLASPEIKVSEIAYFEGRISTQRIRD